MCLAGKVGLVLIYAYLCTISWDKSTILPFGLASGSQNRLIAYNTTYGVDIRTTTSKQMRRAWDFQIVPCNNTSQTALPHLQKGIFTFCDLTFRRYWVEPSAARATPHQVHFEHSRFHCGFILNTKIKRAVPTLFPQHTAIDCIQSCQLVFCSLMDGALDIQEPNVTFSPLERRCVEGVP